MGDMIILKSFCDTLELIGYAAGIGAVAGFITSLTRPPQGRTVATFGIDNRVRFPRIYQNRAKTKKWGVDLGSIGPTLIGAGGAVFVVFVSGVDKSEIGTGTEAQIVDSIGYVQLVVLSIAGGAAGELVFRTLAAGGKVSIDTADEASTAGIARALEAQRGGAPAEDAFLQGVEASRAKLSKPDAESPRDSAGDDSKP